MVLTDRYGPYSPFKIPDRDENMKMILQGSPSSDPSAFFLGQWRDVAYMARHCFWGPPKLIPGRSLRCMGRIGHATFSCQFSIGSLAEFLGRYIMTGVPNRCWTVYRFDGIL